MGYLCNVESAVATCDSYNFDKPNLTRRKNKKKKTKQYHPAKLRRFTFAELESATNGFSPRNLLGKGSHASVFRAVIDGGVLTVAVKKAIASVTATAENELEILSKIWSRRIVNLVGYAVDSSLGGERKKLLLVVEYMPNGSLYDVIHKNPKPPGWSSRVRFALQVAKAVQALHGSNPPVIHRDIKSSNVLVDERENARLSDFGLALRCHVEDKRVLSTPPAGTLGYLDPCYLAPGDLSAKSDIYSFGILLLEIISGRRAIDVNYSPPSIIEWALPLIKSGAYQGICDRRMRPPADPTVSMELALLASRCVRSTAEKRPSMAEVCNSLEMVYKRVKANAAPIWSNLRRRVIHVERSPPLDGGGLEGSDLEERVVRTSRRTLTGRSRKVSSVPSPQNGIVRIDEEMMMTRGRHRVGRSKSVGSFREIKMGLGEGKKKAQTQAQVTVKMSGVIRLRKSRSTSVLHSRSNNNNKNNGIEEQMKKLQIKVVDEFPLLLNLSINKSGSRN